MPVLNKHVIDIPNFRDIEDFVTGTLGGDIVSRSKISKNIHLKADCFSVASTEIWGCSYRAPITLRFQENDYFRIQLHRQGIGATRLGRQSIAITPDQALISDGPAELEFGDNFQQQVLRINRASLTKKMALLADAPLLNPLQFEIAIDRRRSEFNMFSKMLAYIEELSLLPQNYIPAFVFTELEQSLYSAILTTFTHNHHHLLHREAPSAAPWQVKHIEEYIEAHCDQPITIEQLATLVNASPRSIFRAFQLSRGYSPMVFLKRVRLQRARTMLLTMKGLSVTHVAFACGFTDLGRFSRDYSLAYGELPSSTLKKAPSSF